MKMMRTLQLVLLTVSTVITVYEAKVTVEFKMVSYTNDGNRDWLGTPCEALRTSECDTYIKVCLDKPSGSFRQLLPDFSSCSYFSGTSRMYTDSDNVITFGTGADVYGLPNPIVFNITDWEEGFLIKVATYDDDHLSNDDLIDMSFGKSEDSPSENRTAAGGGLNDTISGKRRFHATKLLYNMLVYCSEYHYYGPTSDEVCTVYCKPDNSSTGHYECSETGQKICLPGWNDTSTNCTMAIDDCVSRPCQNEGTCIDGLFGYTCNCTKRYKGLNCEEPVPDPCLEKPCENGGTCEWGFAGFTCTCPPTRTGQNCSLGVTGQGQGLDPGDPRRVVEGPDDDNGLGISTPLLIGLIAGLVLLLLIIIILLALLLSRRRRRKKDQGTSASVDTAAAGQQTTATATAAAGTATYANPLYLNQGAKAGMGEEDQNTYSEVDYDLVKVPLSDTEYDVPRAISAKHIEAGEPSPYYDARLRYSPKSSKAPVFPPDGGVRGGFTPMGTDQHLYRQPDNRFDNPTYDAPVEMGAAGGSGVKKMANLYDEPIKFKL